MHGTILAGRSDTVGATHAVVALEDFGGLKVHCALTDLKPSYTLTTTIQGSKSVSNGEKAAEQSGRRPSDGGETSSTTNHRSPSDLVSFQQLRWRHSRSSMRTCRGGSRRTCRIIGTVPPGCRGKRALRFKKSHTMEVVRHVARLNGYLTASMEVDGSSVSLSNPKEAC